MSTSKFVLLIYGSLCSGKSTVINVLKNRHPDIFHSSVDHIKWFISDYSPNKYAARGVVHRILLAMNARALEEGFSLIVEGSAGLILMRQHYVDISLKYGVPFFEISLETPYAVLLTRFNERIRLFRKKKTRTSVETVEQMSVRYKDYCYYRPRGVPVINSGKNTPEKSADKIEKLLNLRE